MKKRAIFLLALGVLGFSLVASAQTTQPISPFRFGSPAPLITPIISSSTLQIPKLAGFACIGANASGTLILGTCSGGGSATTTINGATGPTFTFATSTDTNVLIQIACLSSTCTYTPVWTGTLADGRIASAGTWNAKESALTFSTGLNRSVNTIVNTGVLSVASTTDIQVSTSTGSGITFTFLNPQGYVTSSIVNGYLLSNGNGSSLIGLTQSQITGLKTTDSPTFAGVTTTAIKISGITGSTQCLHVDTNGVVSGTAGDCGIAGAGITSLNGSTSSTQTFATTTGVGVFTVTTLNGVHTFKIPSNVGFFTNDSGYLSTTTGNWLGTWQSNSPSFFLANSASSTFSWRSNNLSDLNSTSSARSNLGLGDAALTSSSTYAWRSNNLSDLNSTSSARTNLGLGDAALTASSTYLWRANNLSDLNSTSSARTNIGFTAGTGLQLSNLGVFNSTGVLSLNGATGTISGTNIYNTTTTLSAGTGINVSNGGVGATTVTNTAPNFNSTTTLSGGTGITVSNGGVGATTVTNIGVTSNVAGTDITVSNATGTVTISNAFASSTYNWRSNNLSDLNSTSTARTNIGFTAGTGLTLSAGGVFANNGVLSINNATGTISNANIYNTTTTISAGTGIGVTNGGVGATTVSNNGVLTLGGASSTVALTASTSIGIATTTNSIALSAKNYPIQFIIENPNATEDDRIFMFNNSSTITNAYAVNKATGDVITGWNLGYASSSATATSTLFKLFSSNVTSSNTTTSIATAPTASSTPGKGDILRFFNTSATAPSSTQFALTIYYNEK